MKLCKAVTYAYPGMPPVLQNIYLSMELGERLTLSGPSGSGKTTLLYLLAGLLRPLSGIVNTPRVSMVFQENRLPPSLSALEQLRLVAPETPRDTLRSLLRELRLENWENANPRQMSGGMQRRVALARAAAFRAPLWLLDEPFTGLDTETVRLAADFVLRHLPQDGMMIAVLHQPQEAALLQAPLVPLTSLQQRQ